MFDTYESMKPFESRCKWWLPGSPSYRVGGTIAVTGSKLVATMDTWVDANSQSRLPSAELLHGELVDGTPISALNVFVQSRGNELNVVLNLVAVGAHLSSATEQTFSRASTRLNGLDQWWSRTQFGTENPGGDVTSITCHSPTDIKWRFDELQLFIGLGQSQQIIGLAPTSTRVEVTYKAFLTVQPDSPQTFEWFRRLINDTQQFISLMIGQSATQLSLTTTIQDSYDEIRWFWIRGDKEVDDVEPHRILFPFDSVNNQIEAYLQRWLSRSEDLRMARALLFAIETFPFPLMEYRFLPVVQALEVYCNSSGSEKYIATTRFKEIQKSLTEGIPHDLPTALKEKLRTSIGFANELSLGDRIKRLLDALEPETRKFVCQKSAFFADRLKLTRNFYTHYGKSKGKHLTGKALHWATVQASLLLKLVMLKDCEIPESLIQKQLSASHFRTQGMKIWAEIENNLSGE